MHGEPESSYRLRFLTDDDQATLRETEAMERLHRDSALKRQMQQAKEAAPDARIRKRPLSGREPPRSEGPDELLAGAARRLDHIVECRRDSRRVVPTAANSQYPIYRYQYAEKDGGSRRRATSSRRRTALPRVDTTTEPSLKEVVANSSTLMDRDFEPETSAAASTRAGIHRPSFVVTSASAPRPHKLSVELTAQRRPPQPRTARPSSWVSHAKSSKSGAAWLETLPSAADVEAKVAASQAHREPEEPGPHALSPGASCTLTLDS